jgi:mannose-1-phosphate guanylyltransferase
MTRKASKTTPTKRARRGKLHAVVLAGGAGERFWPASRRARPKPFLEVFKGKSLLEATLSRARRMASKDCVWTVCGSEHGRAMRIESGLPANRVLVEPMRRNTAMAVAFVAQRIVAEDPEAVLAILPADHHIPDAAAFVRAIRTAATAARDFEVLVTLGVKPTRPDTGYGYIQPGPKAGDGAAGLRKVRRFVEKPDAARAERYLRQGGYLWNAGIFVWKARSILEELETWAPDIHRALAPIRKSPKRTPRAALESAYRRAPSLPIDVAVLEPSRRVWTLPVDFPWSDVGTWESLAQELGVAPGRGRVIAGETVIDDVGGNLVWAGKRPVALLGVEGLAVVDTEDALLVVKLDQSSRVREVVAELKARGRDDVT